MKCCVLTETWTNWLTFEPDLDYSPDAGTGLLSPISYALQRGILLRRENPTYRYWAPVAAARRGFKMVLFTKSRGNTFVGGTCVLPSALLVLLMTGRNLAMWWLPSSVRRLFIVCPLTVGLRPIVISQKLSKIDLTDTLQSWHRWLCCCIQILRRYSGFKFCANVIIRPPVWLWEGLPEPLSTEQTVVSPRSPVLFNSAIIPYSRNDIGKT